MFLNRATVNEEVLREGFAQTENYYTREKDLNIESSGIFICDEIALQLHIKVKSVLINKGQMNVHDVVNNNEKQIEHYNL